MSQTMHSLRIDQMSFSDRLTLVHEIWQSIVQDAPEPILDDEFRLELDRRIAEDEAELDQGAPWEVVKSEAILRSKVS